MIKIEAFNLSVDFPVYNSHRSLKKSFLNVVTGGSIDNSNSRIVNVRALDNLNFNFSSGDRVGIIGSNGSGKSTLLQVLAGIYEPTSGSVLVKGKVVPLLNLTAGIDLEFTGYENIFLRGMLLGLKKFEILKIIDEVIEFSGVGEFIFLPMRTYSTGMVMRLMFSLITTMKSDIVVMDEWMSVGDVNFALNAEIRLKQMLDTTKIVVIASHDHNMLNSICNKIIKLEHGRLVESH